jgi:hypothetical protein
MGGGVSECTGKEGEGRGEQGGKEEGEGTYETPRGPQIIVDRLLRSFDRIVTKTGVVRSDSKDERRSERGGDLWKGEDEG